MKAMEKKHLLVLTICLVGLISLVVTFILKSWLFIWLFIVLFFLSIIIITVIIPIWFIIILAKQPMTSKDYYEPLIKENYRDLDTELLTKMFEMRITNQRNFIFSYLAFMLTGFLAVVFNLAGLRQYLPNPYYPVLLVLLFGFGVILFIYGSFRIDRETITELKKLLKAMKLLDKLKKGSDDKSEKSLEKLGK